jgi:hypothetical protein
MAAKSAMPGPDGPFGQSWKRWSGPVSSSSPCTLQASLTDANRLAHEIIRELMRRAGWERAEEPAKLLLRRTTVDARLRGEKALERLRASLSQLPHRP